MPRTIEFTVREMHTLRNGLVRYRDFCENCISAFKGTGHDEHYVRLIARIDAVDKKLYNAVINTTDKETDE